MRFRFSDVLLLVLVRAAAASAQEAVVNGGFEQNLGLNRNQFTGWTVVDQKGSSGSWYAQTGTTPVPATLDCSTVNVVPIPPAGFAAMTNMSNPGSHILYQDLVVPTAPNVTFSFDLYIRSRAPFSPKETLDFHATENQQFRADLVDPALAPDEMGSGVLMNAYLTRPTDDPEGFAAYRHFTFDVSSFAGRSVRVRFADTDNVECLIVGLDNVSITAAACANQAPRSIGFAYAGQAGCGPARPCMAGETITFSPNASGYTFQSCDAYAWDFGDGSGAAAQAPSHAYAVPGQYTVRLTVTNPLGSGASPATSIPVVAPPKRRRSSAH